jgi:hypothetical protein
MTGFGQALMMKKVGQQPAALPRHLRARDKPPVHTLPIRICFS